MSGESTRDERGRGVLDALIEGERASMSPPEGAKQRTWKRVAGTVAVGAPLPVEPSSIVGPVASAAASTSWIKIVLGVVLGGVALVGGYRIATDGAEAPTPSRPSAERAEPAVPAPSPAPAAARVGAERVVEPPAAAPEPALVPVQPVTPVAPPSPAAAAVTPISPRAAPPAPPDPPASSDLAEETRLLAAARAHLRSGDPSAALTPLAEHARRFPQGQLSEDRMVLRAQALCESGDLEGGRREASSLRRAFPESSHLPRVGRLCDGG